VSASSPEAAERGAGRLDDRLFIACGLAWLAGLLTTAVAVDRSAVFALVAVAQVAYGVALYRAPRRPVILAGFVLGAALTGIWILVKPASPIEYVVATDDVALALVALWGFRPRATRPGFVRRTLRFAGTSAAVYMILLSSMALMPGSPHSGVKGELISVPKAGFQFICHTG
jgi:hypothetical protein